MVFQQIDFIDVQIAPIGACQKSWFKRFHALRQGTFQIQGADHPVFSGAQW